MESPTSCFRNLSLDELPCSFCGRFVCRLLTDLLFEEIFGPAVVGDTGSIQIKEILM